MDGRIALGWSARPQPLIARAVAATGAVAVALGRRLAALDEDALARLTAVATGGAPATASGDALAVAHDGPLLVVLGDADALPWVDGVEYLGRDVAAPDLLLPTARAPTVPAPALQHALLARLATARGAAPHAVWIDRGVLRAVACGGARAIERAPLDAWLARAAAVVS